MVEASMAEVPLSGGESSNVAGGRRICLCVGVPAPSTRYVRLIMNGEYYGLYLMTEEVRRTIHNTTTAEATTRHRALPLSVASLLRCACACR